MTMDSLNEQLRQKEIFNIEDVEYALLEINGKLSVQKKKELQAVTLKDLQLNAGKATQFPIELVIDGQLLNDTLKNNHIPESRLLSQLKARGKKLEDVFYAVKSSNGQLYVDDYKDNIQHPIDVE
ncbi:DUF421 domain-containing protein [Paenibacillus vietnamensis]|uniref:DUF421 domain-containing protein n=1 Tax=Paenibacillus vietnamensis TaxID=2590547 RepID=UPI00296474E6|nr:YetF domain-containing protein [Paenibacillus vietnamensis]